jgi:hypothetical protein
LSSLAHGFLFLLSIYDSNESIDFGKYGKSNFFIEVLNGIFFFVKIHFFIDKKFYFIDEKVTCTYFSADLNKLNHFGIVILNSCIFSRVAYVAKKALALGLLANSIMRSYRFWAEKKYSEAPKLKMAAQFKIAYKI